jgi:YfiH family protein
MEPMEIGAILPDWPRPERVRAAFTTRAGGVSGGPYDSLNLAVHVGDARGAVAENRRRVRERLGLPAEPAWLTQVHAMRVIDLDASGGPVPWDTVEADASIARRAGTVCAVLVADCLPVLLASRDGRVVGAAHAGWRGLAGGVLEATVRAMTVPPQELTVWLGPAIGPGAFEVGDEVRAAFMAHDPTAGEAFAANPAGRWQCDLYRLARQRLAREGVGQLHGGEYCTWSEPARFFSYRRDGQCGRMAALIWLEP